MNCENCAYENDLGYCTHHLRDPFLVGEGCEFFDPIDDSDEQADGQAGFSFMSDYEFVGLDERLCKEWYYGFQGDLFDSSVSLFFLLGFLAGVAAASPDLRDESDFLSFLCLHRALANAEGCAA